jgi:streptogramin lyase
MKNSKTLLAVLLLPLSAPCLLTSAYAQNSRAPRDNAYTNSAAQSVGSLTSPDSQEAKAGITFTESYWISAFFGAGGASLTDGAVNSKGKTVFTSNGGGTGVGLYFYDGDGAASEGATEYISVQGIAAASDNNFWFVDGNIGGAQGAIGVVNSKEEITEYSPPANTYFEGGITIGSDGAVWVPSFTYSPTLQQVTRVASNGTFTSYTLPNIVEVGEAIATGSDGNVWVQGISYAGDGVYNEELLSVTPSGEVTSYSTGTQCGSYETYSLRGVILGPDGNIWFSSACGLGIGDITPSGVVTFFAFTDPNTELPYYTLASGSDGAVWFTAYSDYLGRIDTSGNVTYTAIRNSLGNYNACANQELIAQTIIPGPKGTLQFYATNSTFGEDTCGTVASFTPEAPGAKQQRQTPKPQVTFGCAGGSQTCEFTILGASNAVSGPNTVLFGLNWTLLFLNFDYTSQIVPGANFGLCDKTDKDGNLLYSKSIGPQFLGSTPLKDGNVLYLEGWGATGFSQSVTGLLYGTKVTCNFLWNFQSCPIGGGGCVTNNNQTITLHATVSND